MFSLLRNSIDTLVLAQASAGDSNSLVGWVLVAVLVSIFAGFVISILRTKPIDPADGETEKNAIAQREPLVETNNQVERLEAVTPVTEGVRVAAKENRYATPETAAPKMKGLKGKKKQQKKKLNAQRGVTTPSSQVGGAVRRDDESVSQPRIAEYTPSSVAPISSVGSSQVDLSAADQPTDEAATAAEPVRLASTYAINAMANKPRNNTKSKEASEKKAQAKGAVQGFHKMDRYREPIRTVDVPIATTAVARVELQSASLGAEEELGRKAERQDRRPRRETTKPIPSEAEGPRTLKEFLTKKPDEE